MSENLQTRIMVGIAVVILVIGVAIGSLVIPITRTQTQLDIIPCPLTYPNGITPPDAPVLFARQNTTVSLCVRYYYYSNSTSPKEFVFNTTFLGVGIGGTTPNESNPHFDFHVRAFPSSLTLGGTSNLNEGAFVLYTISTGDTSNGTYIVDVDSVIYPSLEYCGEFAELIVSNPYPNHLPFVAHCITPVSCCHPLNPYGFVNGYLTAKVVGISNST